MANSLKLALVKFKKTNVRIVAATNLKMMEAIDRGKFREDLFYRLSTIEIDLPPLRETERKTSICYLENLHQILLKNTICLRFRLVDDAVTDTCKLQFPWKHSTIKKYCRTNFCSRRRIEV